MAKILIVDDDPDCVELLIVHLGRRGHIVAGVKNGADALESAAKEKPDLIMLDLRMPSVDGIRVIEILRGDELTAATPVILMSAANREWATRRLPPDPATRFMEKPLDFAELGTLISELVPAARG